MTSAPLLRVSQRPVSVLEGRLLPPADLDGEQDTAVQRQTQASGPESPVIRLGDPGACPSGGITVFIVDDGSPSVADTGGNDPLSRRYAETLLAIRRVAAACRCRRDRVALVPFDEGSTGHVAPQPLTRRGMRTLIDGVRQRASECGLSSDLGPALDRVDAYAARSHGAVALVVLSDFLLTDPNPSAVVERLQAFPGYVHAVVLGAQPPRVLLADPHVAVTRLTPSSPPGSAAQAVFDGLTHYRTHGSSPQGSAAHHHENHHQNIPRTEQFA
ncbi:MULTISPECIES: vWA domain-containing protein [Mycobacteroides]|uniref:VWA domain-containing protein n=1 Tax=Mycobacteroides TaxID=670516 RepID=UPI00092773EC|nr:MULTISPECIES: VWA domain-containing protein [Mycobacteroides]MBF9435238.1 VWA domain-containing protein [Mycobacteroides chelonae]MBN7504588.1 VWA domain-containing protein [Mycobacteroides abscessus subsp. massiliense]MDO3037414.1 VWA domain-containing protein [Mycobacteroides abscessus subsp. abscessus]MDO3111325.1 VWA domain-containing protein [Mycobacteroides abscessus subsp. massiliense]MDO3260474.1 VWA domain-containing protein [Mycobacteroides abscessus subsp. abscessus]